jgi:valyl-tRNA synthetase
LEIRIPMEGLFDIQAERARLQKDLGKSEAELQGLLKKLENPQFVARAKPEVVTEARQRVTELEARGQRLHGVLRELGDPA